MLVQRAGDERGAVSLGGRNRGLLDVFATDEHLLHRFVRGTSVAERPAIVQWWRLFAGQCGGRVHQVRLLRLYLVHDLVGHGLSFVYRHGIQAL